MAAANQGAAMAKRRTRSAGNLSGHFAFGVLVSASVVSIAEPAFGEPVAMSGIDLLQQFDVTGYTLVSAGLIGAALMLIAVLGLGRAGQLTIRADVNRPRKQSGQQLEMQQVSRYRMNKLFPENAHLRAGQQRPR